MRYRVDAINRRRGRGSGLGISHDWCGAPAAVSTAMASTVAFAVATRISPAELSIGALWHGSSGGRARNSGGEDKIEKHSNDNGKII